MMYHNEHLRINLISSDIQNFKSHLEFHESVSNSALRIFQQFDIFVNYYLQLKLSEF